VPFKSLDREAFNGLALVIIKAIKGAKGSIQVKACSDRLKEDQIKIVIN